jgi:hypothetical protein
MITYLYCEHSVDSYTYTVTMHNFTAAPTSVSFLDSFSSPKAAASDQTITADGISALEYLLGCEFCTESERKPTRLREVALLQSELAHCGYSKVSSIL